MNKNAWREVGERFRSVLLGRNGDFGQGGMLIGQDVELDNATFGDVRMSKKPGLDEVLFLLFEDGTKAALRFDGSKWLVYEAHLENALRARKKMRILTVIIVFLGIFLWWRGFFSYAPQISSEPPRPLSAATVPNEVKEVVKTKEATPEVTVVTSLPTEPPTTYRPAMPVLAERISGRWNVNVVVRGVPCTEVFQFSNGGQYYQELFSKGRLLAVSGGSFEAEGDLLSFIERGQGLVERGRVRFLDSDSFEYEILDSIGSPTTSRRLLFSR